MRETLEIMFQSSWHISASMSGGVVADSILVRDEKGIPFIPGRALKGALREGAEVLGQCREDLKDCISFYFGSRSDTSSVNQPGCITISNGEIPSDVYSYLLSKNDVDRDLFVSDMAEVRIQTALEDGQVKTGSLRSIECGIPGIFFKAQLECENSLCKSWDVEYFKAVCAAVKFIGAGRTKGLGRCVIKLGEHESNISVPEVWPLFEGGKNE